MFKAPSPFGEVNITLKNYQKYYFYEDFIS